MAPTPLNVADVDLASLIRPGDRVVCGQGSAEPRTLTQALVTAHARLPDVEIFLGAVYSDAFDLERTQGLRFVAYGTIGRTLALARAGRLDHLPLPYSALHQGFASGRLRADVVLIQLAPSPRGNGYCLGLSNDYVAAAARHARVVIAEVNEATPSTFGCDWDDSLRIDALVRAEHPPVERPAVAGGAAEQAIARHIAALVPDRAVLQTGIGTVPDAAMAALSDHRDLGIHSGVIGDGVADLIRAGAVTNAHKPIDAGITVTGCLFGTKPLFELAHNNKTLAVRAPDYTHGHEVLRQLTNFVAINSAIEVDLTGQVNAETVDGVVVGGIGGLPDFIRGAAAAPRGRSIIALPATARNGASRIVPQLRGSTVTVAKNDVDTIVTEFGVAELRGLTLAERRRRMIALAAPSAREELERAVHTSRED